MQTLKSMAASREFFQLFNMDNDGNERLRMQPSSGMTRSVCGRSSPSFPESISSLDHHTHTHSTL